MSKPSLHSTRSAAEGKQSAWWQPAQRWHGGCYALQGVLFFGRQMFCLWHRSRKAGWWCTCFDSLTQAWRIKIKPFLLSVFEGTLHPPTMNYSPDKEIWKYLLEANGKVEAWMKKRSDTFFKFGKGQGDVSYPWMVEVPDSVHSSRVLSLLWVRTISSVETQICTGGFT